jgi:WD40 repeat protein
MADGTHDIANSAGAGPGRLKVFISYSRDDLDFADQLVAALELCGFEPSIDRHGISGGEAWQLRLGALILEADTVLFVLSPASARSDICGWEVEEAARLGKRILPVLARPLHEANPPLRLQDLNYVFFYAEPKSPGSGFGTGLAGLVASLNTDLSWIREHTRLLERAMEWDTGGRPAIRLLSGSDIVQAKAWAARRPKGAPEPTAMHLDFIRASEEEEAGRASAERKRLEDMAAAQSERAKALQAAEQALRNAANAQRARARAQSIVVSISVISALVLAAVTGYAFVQKTEAERQRTQAQAERTEAQNNLHEAQVTQTRALIDAAKREAETGDYSTSILLSLEALPDPEQGIERPFVYEAKEKLTAGLAGLRERAVFEGEATFSSDGGRVLTTAPDKTPRLWDTAGNLLFLLGGPEDVGSAELSPNGAVVLTRPKEKAPRLWNAATGKELFALGGDEPTIGSALFSPDSKLVLTGSRGKFLRVRDIATGGLLFRLGNPEEELGSAVFSPSGEFVVTSSKGRSRIWDVASGKELLLLGSEDLAVTRIQVSRDGKFVLMESNGKNVHLWDTATGRRRLTLDGPEEQGIRSATISPDSRHVLTMSRSQSPPRLWDVTEANGPIALGEVGAAAASFSPDGKLVFTSPTGRAPRLWDAFTGQERFALGDRDTAKRGAFFSPDSGFLLTLSSVRRVRLWNTATGEEIELKLKDSDEAVPHATRVLFSPDSRLVMTVSDKASVSIWSTSGGKELFRLAANSHSINRDVAFSPDSALLLTNSTDSARLWDLTPDRPSPAADERTKLQSVIDLAKATVRRCLTPSQRHQFFLDPEPPRWCTVMAKPPYDVKAWQAQDAVDEIIAEEYGNYADDAVRAGDFRMALKEADLGIKFAPFAPNLTWIRMNRAHALMFLDRDEEALAEHESHRGTVLPVHGLWATAVLKDFASYREKGREHRLMSVIEKLLQPAAPAP